MGCEMQCKECSYDGCNNKVFKSLDKCALHCVKSEYQVDSHNGLLSEFNTLLKDIVIDDILKEAKKGEKPYIDLIIEFINRKFSYQELEEKSREIEENYKGDTVLNNILSNKLLIFNGIHFPERDSRDPFDYMKWLIYIGSIYFQKCIFYLSHLYFENTKVFFDECIFKKYFCFYPAKLLENAYDIVFSHCVFTEKVSVAPSGDRPKDNIYKHRIFYNCDYLKGITIRGCKFEAEIFYREKDDDKYHSNKVDVLEVKNCIFDEKLKINNFKISSLLIEDTIFNLKLEVKESVISIISFKNSNVEKVFDAFGSEFEKSYFYKSIFNDFAGFEDVQFGSIQEKSNKDFLTVFKYVTFMDFSSFRGAAFSSGLDFSKTNLKDTPNFLDVYVSPENTNRETFRIIKNSFDEAGNTIEANRFFTMEMKAYKLDLEDSISKKSDFETKAELLVLEINELLSNFGASYVRPIIILIVITFPYAIILYIHNYIYSDKNKVYPKFVELPGIMANGFANGFQPISRFLVAGMEFFSLLYYIVFSILLWQIIVSIKRKVKR